MHFDRTFLIRYFYTVGVMLSGVYFQRTFDGLDIVILVGITMFVAVPWTLYYRFTVVPKLEIVRERAEDDGS